MANTAKDFMGERFALLAIRLLVSVNLLYAAIFFKFAAVPDFGGSLHADVASGPWVGISAGVPARVRCLRDGGGGSAPYSENS
jgi:hypothetical protein